MDPTWVVLADEGRARILELRERGADLEEIDEMTHASAHARSRDLNYDQHGRRSGGGGLAAGNATVSAGESDRDKEAELFARRLSQHLSDARRRNRYAQLRIVAAPRFLGRLRKSLDADVVAALVDEQAKDLLQLDRRTLTQQLFGTAGRPAP
jgi:protein required for attachment to host cells